MISRGEISHLLARAATAGPDADQIIRDDAGVKWMRYAVDWSYQDRTYTTHLWAISAVDAELRLQALRSNAVVVGQVYCERSVG